MSSRRGGGSGSKLPSVGPIASYKGKKVLQVSDLSADQLVSGVEATRLDSEQDGVWEVGRKPKNRYVGKDGSQNSNAKVLGNFRSGTKGHAHGFGAPTGDIRMHVGRSNAHNQSSYIGWECNYGQPAVTSHRSYKSVVAKVDDISASRPVDDISDKEEDIYDDSDENANDFYDSDEYDTDESQKSHETRKKNKLFKDFFEDLDMMNLDEIKEWHCPACKNGPGATFWYKGLQPLMNHAKTIRNVKAKVHREFAELLEEELRIRGTYVIPSGVAFGKWRGLKENVVRDKEIVWPPMVIIMNTFLEQDNSGKWLGMGNAELLEYFSPFEAVSSKHSYGPQGHRGMSLLIFEASAIGFIEAEQLSNQFEDEGLGREAWHRCRDKFVPGGGGQRQLYGYMPEKRDLDNFNQHSHGRSIQKFEMRSYQEMVINQLKQMREDNQLLLCYKNKADTLKKELRVLKGSFDTVTEKMRKVSEENRIVRQKTMLHYRQYKEEMDEQENFHRNTIQLVDDARREMEEKLEKIQQEREVTEQHIITPAEDRQSSRIGTGTISIWAQQKDLDIYAEERSKLLKDQEEKKAELKRRHYGKEKLEEQVN